MTNENKGVRKFIAGSALVAMLASAPTIGLAASGSDANLPRIQTTANFKTGFLPGTRTYTNYVEMAVTFPVAGTYHLEMSTNLLDSNGWMQFGKTNTVTAANNTTKSLVEYAPAQINNAYFRVAGTTNAPAPSSNLSLSTKKISPSYTTLNTTKRLVR